MSGNRRSILIRPINETDAKALAKVILSEARKLDTNESPSSPRTSGSSPVSGRSEREGIVSQLAPVLRPRELDCIDKPGGEDCPFCGKGRFSRVEMEYHLRWDCR